MSIYLLSDSYHEGVINLPQIKINFIRQDINFFYYDALIFTSKNSVKAIEKFSKDWKKLPAYSIGKATSKAILDFGGELVYESKKAYGDEFAKELAPLLKGKRVLFLRAKEVLSDLEQILKDNSVLLYSKVVYETVCENFVPFEFENNSLFIFTSPSTVKCFFKNYNWREDFTAVCIGKVTSKALPLHVKRYISKKQTIKASIEFAKTLIKQS
jgi:uroporphyrinogen-III synthase